MRPNWVLPPEGVKSAPSVTWSEIHGCGISPGIPLHGVLFTPETAPLCHFIHGPYKLPSTLRTFTFAPVAPGWHRFMHEADFRRYWVSHEDAETPTLTRMLSKSYFSERKFGLKEGSHVTSGMFRCLSSALCLTTVVALFLRSEISAVNSTIATGACK